MYYFVVQVIIAPGVCSFILQYKMQKSEAEVFISDENKEQNEDGILSRDVDEDNGNDEGDELVFDPSKDMWVTVRVDNKISKNNDAIDNDTYWVWEVGPITVTITITLMLWSGWRGGHKQFRFR